MGTAVPAAGAAPPATAAPEKGAPAPAPGAQSGDPLDKGAPAQPPADGAAPAALPVQPPGVGTDGIPLTGKLIDGDAWKLAQASMIAAPSFDAGAGEEALQLYPDLMPPTRASAIATATSSGPVAIPGLTPEEAAYGQDYTKGFALGYVESYAKAYTAARDVAYGPAWQNGWLRGQAEYHRLANGADGHPLPTQDGIDLARKAMLTGHYQEAIDRLDIVIAGAGSTPLLDVALYWKAAAYYYWGKPQSAIDTARKVVEVTSSPHADDAYFLMGAAYEAWKEGGFLGLFAHRHDADAAVNYQIAAEKFPGSAVVPRALLHLGGCRERLHQRLDAVAAYKRLATEFASSPEAIRATARLKALGAAR